LARQRNDVLGLLAPEVDANVLQALAVGEQLGEVVGR
jgi:hypothetical protein